MCELSVFIVQRNICAGFQILLYIRRRIDCSSDAYIVSHIVKSLFLMGEEHLYNYIVERFDNYYAYYTSNGGVEVDHKHVHKYNSSSFV